MGGVTKPGSVSISTQSNPYLEKIEQAFLLLSTDFFKTKSDNFIGLVFV